MKITIDTKSDKPHEIKRAIDMLTRILDMSPDVQLGGESYNQEPSAEAREAPNPEPNVFNIFGDMPSGQSKEEDERIEKVDTYNVDPDPQKEDFNLGNYTEEPQDKDKKELRPYF
ncbi:hypothetical protein JXB11_00480 [Candidatus Woesearchaeota archaeon]|nr:hypothetical protein [Candidatus Woesearchaeota archaeon]